MKPYRVQLRRIKGWRLPANTVVVTRPGKWGNPFRVGDWFRLTAAGWDKAARAGEKGFIQIADHAMAVDWFVRWMEARRPDVSALRGKNLACWCRPGGPCHAEVLLRWANRAGKRSSPVEVAEDGTFHARTTRGDTMKTKKKKWSAKVSRKSDAMDLKKNVFKQADPKKIAKSVKASAAKSKRRKAPPKRSAMSMLSFYENRAGKNLSAAQKKKIKKAKDELRKLPE